MHPVISRCQYLHLESSQFFELIEITYEGTWCYALESLAIIIRFQYFLIASVLNNYLADLIQKE